AAEVDLDGWRKPAQIVAVRTWVQERRFREVHFARDILHPAIVTRRGENTDRGRVAGERNCGERVYLDKRNHKDIMEGKRQKAKVNAGAPHFCLLPFAFCLEALNGLHQIPVRDFSLIPRLREILADLIRYHHRPVMPTGAAEADREITLALPDVMRQQIDQQLGDAVDELHRLWERT